MASVQPLKFSPNGEFLAYSHSDGTLKIWETQTSTLKHEYTPSSHLSATCTCISWGVVKGHTSKKKKKKRKSLECRQNTEGVQLIAMGTTSGVILLYSLAKGDLLTQLSEGHAGSVTSVCWGANGDVLYSCSTDHHIVEWDVKEGKVKRKWSGDKSTITSLSLCHTGRHLISAGRTIKVWDLQTHDVIQTFTGHSTLTFDLISVPNNCVSLTPNSPGVKKKKGVGASGDSEQMEVNGEEEADSVEGSYFFSAAAGDRLINAWQVSSAAVDKNSVASFSLPDVPTHIHFTPSYSRAQTFLLSAVTKSGHMVIFENQLNGRCKKPLKPSVQLQIATSSEGRDSMPRPIPVIASYIQNDSHRNITIVYGNLLQPKFETLVYEKTEREMCLVREDPNKTAISLQSTVDKVRTAGVSEDVTVLAPGHMAPVAQSVSGGQGAVKNKRKRTKSIDMTMEERLNAISVDDSKPQQSTSGVTQPPKADTMATLLTQGLQSHDTDIIASVLTKNNDALIKNTVNKLSLPVIVPLIQELSTRLQTNAQMGVVYIKWVKCVLIQHTSYLMSFPELVESISQMYHVLEARNTTMNRMARLQGKLDLMLSQATSRQENTEATQENQQALLVYQEESSDEENAAPEGLSSEDEGNWAEMDLMQKTLDSDQDMEEIEPLTVSPSSKKSISPQKGSSKKTPSKKSRKRPKEDESSGLGESDDEDVVGLVSSSHLSKLNNSSVKSKKDKCSADVTLNKSNSHQDDFNLDSDSNSGESDSADDE